MLRRSLMRLQTSNISLSSAVAHSLCLNSRLRFKEQAHVGYPRRPSLAIAESGNAFRARRGRPGWGTSAVAGDPNPGGRQDISFGMVFAHGRGYVFTAR